MATINAEDKALLHLSKGNRTGREGPILGTGRALPQSGLSAWQPGRSSKANKIPVKSQEEPSGCFTFLLEDTARTGYAVEALSCRACERKSR